MKNENGFSSAITHVGFNLLNQLLLEFPSKEAVKNLFVSPFSLHFALGLLIKGAKSDTQRELINLLGFTEEQLEDFFSYSQNLSKTLSATQADIQLLNALACWVNQRFPLKDEFVSWAQQAYQAQVQNRDFSDSYIVHEINHWVNEATQQHIDRVIERLSPSTIAVIVNAVFFKGSWQNAFDPRLTKAAPFYLITNTSVETPMMHQKGKFNYLYAEEWELLQLPYQGEQSSFIVVLPHKEICTDLSKLQTFTPKLTQLNLLEHVSKTKKVEVSVALPRFRIACSVELSKTFQELGVKSAFSESLADFSAMCTVPPRVFISEVLHKTTLDVHEQGTEASAATQITMVSKALPKITSFIVNRPFYCAILHQQFGLLFHGWVFNPQ